MIRLNHICAVLVACLVVGNATANSIFSYHHRGLGYWEWRGDARNMGMAGTSVGVFDTDNPISTNPAIIGGFEQTSLTGTFLSQKRIAKDHTGLYGTFYEQHPRILRAVVPLGYGVVSSVGLEPLSDVRMVWSSKTLSGELMYLDSLEASGGLWAASFQFGRRFGAFSVGLRMQLVRGSATTEWRRTILEQDAVLATSALLTRRFSGTALAIGLSYQPRPDWTVGTAIDLPTTLDETDISSLGTRIPSAYFPRHEDQSTRVSPDLEDTARTTVTLPFGIALGSSWRPNGNVLLTLDVEFRQWSQASPEFRDTWRMAFGTEIHPSTNYRSFRLLQWPYRVGLRWEEHYIPSQDTPSGRTYPDGWFATIGFGIPLGDGLGRIDYSFEHGQRGTIGTNLAREKVWRHTISVVGWERWFVRRPHR